MQTDSGVSAVMPFLGADETRLPCRQGNGNNLAASAETKTVCDLRGTDEENVFRGLGVKK